MDLEATVRDLAPRVLRYAHVLTGDRTLAEETAQEALTALVRRWHGQGPPDSPEAFVFSIARRRAGRAVVRRGLWLPIDALLGARDGRPTPEERVLAGSERKRMLACLARLARRDREALLMVAVGCLSTSNAAEALRISVSALKMRTLRARQRLRDLLDRLARPMPVEMQFQDAPVSTVLRAMSEAAGLEITADEPLMSRHVTLTGSGRTVQDAFKAVIEQAGGGVTVFRMRDTGTDSPEIRIAIKPKAPKTISNH